MNIHRPTLTALACLLACVVAFGGCASKNELETLQTQAQRDRQESNRRIQELEAQLSESRTALKDEIQQSSSPVRATQANIWSQVESLQVRVAKLEGQLENLSMRMDSQLTADNGTRTLDDVARDVDAIKFALQTQLDLDLAAPAAPRAALDGDGELAMTPTPAPTDPAQALYATALTSFKQRNYDEARRHWAEFVEAFKTNPLVSNAIFWQGECFYQTGDFANAILQYQDVIEKFPKSQKYRSAMLKQGIAFHRLGKAKPGDLRLKALVDQYPDSIEAKRAKQYLEDNK